MFEANHPEINVDELMRKIRQEVSNRKVNSIPMSILNNPEASRMMSIINYIEALLKNAESRAFIRTKWPDKLNRFPFNFPQQIQNFILKSINFFFKDQREVNFNLIFSLKESIALNRQLVEQITTLRTQMDEVLSIVDIRFQGINNRLDSVDNCFQGIDERLDAVDNCFQGIDERLDAVDNCFQGIDERLNAVDNCFQGIDERLDAGNNHAQEMDENFNTIDSWINTWMTATEEHLNAVNKRFQGIDVHLEAVDDRIQGLDEHHKELNEYQKQLDERYIKNDSYLKNDLMQQKRLIAMFIEEARRRLPESFNQEQLQNFIKEDQHLLDAFYVAFEDQFRGSREDIFERLKVYLPIIQEAKIGIPDSPILDVGCGRGEWLELLRKYGYTARGIDINRVMLEQCQARELEVIEADVITYLQSLPNDSLGAVTGFHIIEHLAFTVLIKLFDEALRVLKPGGLVIFETPNPDNVLVGSNTFYLDPTHRNPLPSSMIKFVAESQGLCQVTIMKLHPYHEKFILSASDVAERFNEYFYGAQDYAVIGYKA
jgi:SAM-dependent methyltransferase/archaellum component FlaC